MIVTCTLCLEDIGEKDAWCVINCSNRNRYYECKTNTKRCQIMRREKFPEQFKARNVEMVQDELVEAVKKPSLFKKVINYIFGKQDYSKIKSE